MSASYAAHSEPGQMIDQGWNEEQMQTWGYATQGSRLLPMSWFYALELADGSGMLSDGEYLESLGYLMPPAGWEFDRPIGFASDIQKDGKFRETKLRWFRGQGKKEPWVGFNCAACHTGAFDTDQGRMIVNGAPGMGDFQSFTESVFEAMEATSADEQRFDRFATRVLSGKDNASNRNRLRSALDQLIEYQGETLRMNSVDSRYGHARVDAFGYIFNKTLQLANEDRVEGNVPDAPVSYPFLWDISRQKKVQWNGMAENMPVDLPGHGQIDIGALGRNAGEVIGVFGEVVTKRRGFTGLPNYESSVNVTNLNSLENTLAKLEPPTWEKVFGTSPADSPEMVGRGRELFDSQCASCHMPRSKWVEGEPIEKMVSLKEMSDSGDLTDTAMACNAFNYAGPTGRLKGTRMTLTKRDRHTEVAPVADLLTTTVSGVLVDEWDDIVEAGIDNIFRPGKLAEIQEPDVARLMLPPPPAPGGRMPASVEVELPDFDCIEKSSNGYKARPLDGVFATGPFLHNGSVPTLYHLLLPASARPTSFWVGNRTFDRKNVGFAWEQAVDEDAFEFHVRDQRGRPIKGNSNVGHEYGAQEMDDDDRWALVAYLKSI